MARFHGWGHLRHSYCRDFLTGDDAPRATALGEVENLGVNKGTQTVERTISRSVQTVSARRAAAQAAEAVQAA